MIKLSKGKVKRQGKNEKSLVNFGITGISISFHFLLFYEYLSWSDGKFYYLAIEF